MKNKNMILLAVVSAAFGLASCDSTGGGAGYSEVTKDEFVEKANALSTENPYSKLEMAMTFKNSVSGMGEGYDTSEEESETLTIEKNSEGEWMADYGDGESEATDVSSYFVSTLITTLEESTMGDSLGVELAYHYYYGKNKGFMDVANPH